MLAILQNIENLQITSVRYNSKDGDCMGYINVVCINALQWLFFKIILKVDYLLLAYIMKVIMLSNVFI